jgi:hypothetical protein
MKRVLYFAKHICSKFLANIYRQGVKLQMFTEKHEGIQKQFPLLWPNFKQKCDVLTKVSIIPQYQISCYTLRCSRVLTSRRQRYGEANRCIFASQLPRLSFCLMFCLIFEIKVHNFLRISLKEEHCIYQTFLRIVVCEKRGFT